MKPAVGRECPRALKILPLTLDSGGLALENRRQRMASRQGPRPSPQPITTTPRSSRGRWAPRACGTRTPGGGSQLVVGHLQELRIHVPDALPLGVEQELVVAAVRTDRWAEETMSLRVESKQPALSSLHRLSGG